MQESSLENLNYGDRDSLGLFQQRPSAGWAAPPDHQPVYAADAFLHALAAYQVADPGWATQPLWEAAQGVQRSAFPYAYAQWESQAAHIVAQATRHLLSPAPPGPRGCPSPPGGARNGALRAAWQTGAPSPPGGTRNGTRRSGHNPGKRTRLPRGGTAGRGRPSTGDAARPVRLRQAGGARQAVSRTARPDAPAGPPSP